VKILVVLSLALIFSPFSVATEDEHSDMHDLMAHLLTPASEAIWESSGYVITEEGEFSLEPTNEEEWERVLYGAKVITESAYLLNIPSRSKNRKEWIIFAGLLEDVGERAFEAAENKDVESLFEIGAELYQVCVSCHQVYMVE
tara:strand:- start:1252 stop:1680 length:429 start_codon:yes stop_codon:yes gene_type:complete